MGCVDPQEIWQICVIYRSYVHASMKPGQIDF